MRGFRGAQTSQEATAISPARNDGGPSPCDSGGGGEKWRKALDIPRGFADRLDVGCERKKKKSRIAPKFLAQASGRMKFAILLDEEHQERSGFGVGESGTHFWTCQL